MPLHDNFLTIVKPRKKLCKRTSSLETPRTLLTKVIEDKIQRHSSTYIFNEKSSSGYKKTKENMASRPIDENVYFSGGDSDDDITADYLLIGKETSQSVGKIKPSGRSPTKREFKFSSMPKRPLQSSHNVKEKHVSKSKKVASNITKATEKRSLEKIPSRTKTLEHYYHPVSREKSLKVDKTNVGDISKSKASTDDRRSKSALHNLAPVNNKTSPARTKRKLPITSKGKSAMTTPLSKSNPSMKDKASKSQNISSPRPEKSDNSELRVPSRYSTRLRERDSQSKSMDVNKKKLKSSALLSSPPQVPESMSVDLPSSSFIKDVDCEEVRPSKPTKKPQQKKQHIISRMIGDNTSQSTSHGSKLHSTAVNTQTLGFDVSGIEPMEDSFSMSEKSLQHSILDSSCHARNNELENSDSANSEVLVDQLLMNVCDPADENHGLLNIPRVPDDITRHIIQHFSKRPVASSAMTVLNVCCNDFWKQTLETLQAYAKHGQRMIPNVADVELLLYRQGHARDRNEMNSLIERYLPLDVASKITVSVAAGNELQNT